MFFLIPQNREVKNCNAKNSVSKNTYLVELLFPFFFFIHVFLFPYAWCIHAVWVTVALYARVCQFKSQLLMSQSLCPLARIPTNDGQRTWWHQCTGGWLLSACSRAAVATMQLILLNVWMFEVMADKVLLSPWLRTMPYLFRQMTSCRFESGHIRFTSHM